MAAIPVNIGMALFFAMLTLEGSPMARCIRYKDSQGTVLDSNSLMQTSKVLLKSNSRSQENGVKVGKEYSTPTEGLEGGFGDELKDTSSDTEGMASSDTEGMVAHAVANVLPTQAFMQTASVLKEYNFKQLSAASAKKLDDLYVNINSRVDPEFLRQLKIRAPEIIHELHLAQKGPIYYPHMHVVNHKIVPATGNGHALHASALAPRASAFDDERMTLTLLCFALVGLSSFFNIHRKGDKGMVVSHDLHDLHHAEVDSKKLSIWDGTISTFTSILGMGFLTLPYAMSLAGWIAGPLIVFFSLCSGYTAHLLTWSLSQAIDKAKASGLVVPEMPSWGFLLGAAYGARAERSVNMFLVAELWGYCLSGIVATALNLNQLVDDISVSTAIGITVLVQYVLTMVSARTLTKINVVTNALFLACCLMFIVTGLLLPTKAPAAEFRWVKPEGILAACGIIVFSPASHSLYPAMMQRMEKPKEYPVCIRRAYFMATIVYVCFAVPGFYLFGNAVQPSAVRNIGVDRNLVPLPNLGWMNPVAAFCMVMKMAGLQPLILQPLNGTIECMMQGWAPQSILSTMIPPIVLTLSAVVAMHFANQMAALLNIVGSVFCMSIAFVLPALCYWKLNKPYVGKVQQWVLSGLIMMGGSFAILGLITALDG